jgi:hypothetical protein
MSEEQLDDLQPLDLHAFLPADISLRAQRVVDASLADIVVQDSAMTWIELRARPILASAAAIIAFACMGILSDLGSTANADISGPVSAVALGVDPTLAQWASRNGTPSTAEIISALNYR